MKNDLLKDKICAKLEDKKALDIELIDLENKSSLADYFIVASGASRIQVKALANEVQDMCTQELGLEPKKVTGIEEGLWALLDYGSVVVHIFHPEERATYKLEQFWQEREKSEFIDP